MSLDVSLMGEPSEINCTCLCGHTHTKAHREEYFSSNITHNLNSMAEEAGIYQHLWRPEELGITKAEQLIAPLTEGLKLLNGDCERFKKHNPENGWGTYEGLVRFVYGYLQACIQHPTATIDVSR